METTTISVYPWDTIDISHNLELWHPWVTVGVPKIFTTLRSDMYARLQSGTNGTTTEVRKFKLILGL